MNGATLTDSVNGNKNLSRPECLKACQCSDLPLLLSFFPTTFANQIVQHRSDIVSAKFHSMACRQQNVTHQRGISSIESEIRQS